MKRILCVVFVFCVIVSFSGCGTEFEITESNHDTSVTEPVATKNDTETPAMEIVAGNDSDVDSLDRNEQTTGNITQNQQNVTENQPKNTADRTMKKPSSSKKSTSSKTTSSGKKTTVLKTNTATTSSVFLTGITAHYTGKTAKVGDKILANNFSVIANYSDNSTKEIKDFSLSASKFDSVGKKTVTVTYKNKTCAVKIDVLAGNDPKANPGSEFGYKVNNGELTITQYVGAKTDVIVPAWIDDMPVTGIYRLSDDVTSIVLPDSIKTLERHAFSDNDHLTTVTLGPNIINIGDNVFYHCDNLKNVTFKAGAKIIGQSMFSACKSLEKIVLPEGVEKIEKSAFANCDNLKFITIPASVTYIGDYGNFSGCYKLEKIYVKQNSYAQRWLLNNGYGKLIVY